MEPNEMEDRKRTDFCTECRKETEYILKKEDICKTIRGKSYQFRITVAICTECGAEMSPLGLIDKNVQEIDEQFRRAEGIVTIDDIEKLMKIYKIGKAPLSLTLGFGEVTIARYLSGQIPSKEYSEIIKMALSSPSYMKKCLNENRNKIADTAYRKAMDSASQLENLFCMSPKLLGVISYIFDELEEVTPLTLQKLLYYTQGIYLALYDTEIFEEECEAWVHGPVYADVYDLFKDFKYNPIEDARFAILDGRTSILTPDEKKITDLIVRTFGLYGGKVLERITHNETPWKEARKGYPDTMPSRETISKDSMKKYFKEVNEEYRLDSESGLNQYIQNMCPDVAIVSVCDD